MGIRVCGARAVGIGVWDRGAYAWGACGGDFCSRRGGMCVGTWGLCIYKERSRTRGQDPSAVTGQKRFARRGIRGRVFLPRFSAPPKSFTIARDLSYLA